MDIYSYHLEHPEESQWHVSLAFGVSKGTVWNAYRFMEKEIEYIAHDFVVAHFARKQYLCRRKLLVTTRKHVCGK